MITKAEFLTKFGFFVLFVVVFHQPFNSIIFNIFPYFIIILLIANNVVII